MVLAYTAVYLSRHPRAMSEMSSTTPTSSLKESMLLLKLKRSALANDVGTINYGSSKEFYEDDSNITDPSNINLSGIISNNTRRLIVKKVILLYRETSVCEKERKSNILKSTFIFDKIKRAFRGK